jgi:DNA-binding HxlR family transcriptional regulator
MHTHCGRPSGLIERNLVSAMPLGVEYRLSLAGVWFVEPVQLLYDWGIENADALDAPTPRSRLRHA